MSLLESLLTSGRIVDLMIAVLVLEVLAITVFRETGRGGIALVPLLVNIGAGGSLIKPLTDARPGGSRIHYVRDPFGNIIELLQLPEGSGGAITSLPGVEAQGVYAEPTDEYYVFEDGEFTGMRSKAELP